MGIRELSDLNRSAAFNERTTTTVIAMIKSVPCFLGLSIILLKWLQAMIELFRLLIFRLSRFLLPFLKQRFCKFVMSAPVIRIELYRGLESLNRSVDVSFFHS